MNILCLTLGFFVFIELLSRILESKAIADTAVSSITESNYSPSTFLCWARILTVIIALTLVTLTCLLGGNAKLILGIIIIFMVVRVFCLKVIIDAAEASVSSRLNKVLAGEDFTNSSFIFYFSAPDLREPTHVDMWIEPLSSLQNSWFVVLRERSHLNFFKSSERPNAVFIENGNQLASVLPENADLIFYANNGQKNRFMMNAKPSATHIQLLHGDSDKPPSYSPLSNNYDYLFVAGQMAIDRYRNHGIDISADKFKIVGRPQVRSIETTATPKSIKTVGYMPTWKGFFEDTQFSSLDRAGTITRTVVQRLSGANLLFKPHPMSFKDPSWKQIKRDVLSQISQNGRVASPSETPFDIMNASDVLITDISSVMIDYLYSGRPLIVVLPKGFDDSDAWRYPSLAAAYLVDADLNNLEDIITLAATEDPMQAKRMEIRNQAFGDIDKRPGEAFKEVCLNLLNKNYK